MSDEENNQNDSGTEEHEEERASPAKSEEPRQKSHSPPPRSRSSRHDGPPPTKLYVGNLPEDCKRSELSALFEKYGKLEKCDVLRSFAFVHYERAEDASKAVEKLDDTEFMGVHIQVQHAKSKGKPNAGDNECFECGREGHWARDCPRRRRYDSYRRPPPPRSSYREPYRSMDSYRGPDSYRGLDSYRGPERGYRDTYYSDSYYGSRHSAPPRYSPYSPYGGYGGRSMRSRSPPPRSYHSSYAYAPRR